MQTAYTDRLKEARKRKGLSQGEFARLLGIGTSTVSGYETGIRDPSMETLHRMMTVLGVDANFIFQDETKTMSTVQLTNDERELLLGYQALNDTNKGLLLKTMHYLADSEDMEVIINKVKEWGARQEKAPD